MSRIIQHTKSITGDWDVEDNLSLAPKAPGSVVVGLTSSLIVPEYKARKGLILENISGGKICLAFGVDAVLNKGITLYPGGVFNMGPDDFYKGNIYAIAELVDSLMTVQEFG